MNERRQGILTSIGLLLLRVGVGGYLMTHGFAKLQWLAAGEFDKFADPIGMGNKLGLFAATGAEFFCALLVALGLLTRLAALPPAFVMCVAAFVVHKADPYTMTAAAGGVSKEPAMLFLIPMLTLVFTGPGWFSLDALVYPYLGRRRAQRRERRQKHSESK